MLVCCCFFCLIYNQPIASYLRFFTASLNFVQHFCWPVFSTCYYRSFFYIVTAHHISFHGCLRTFPSYINTAVTVEISAFSWLWDQDNAISARYNNGRKSQGSKQAIPTDTCIQQAVNGFCILRLLNDIELRFPFHCSSLLDIIFGTRKAAKKDFNKSMLIEFSPINHIFFRHFVLRFTKDGPQHPI